MKYSFVAFV